MGMKMLRLMFVTLLPFIAVEIGSACTCVPTNAQEASRRSDTVFRGELIAHRGRSAVFQVREYWKGNLKSSVKVEWRLGDRGDCNGFWPNDLRVGNELLVFAIKGRDGVYRTSICLPTMA